MTINNYSNFVINPLIIKSFLATLVLSSLFACSSNDQNTNFTRPNQYSQPYSRQPQQNTGRDPYYSRPSQQRYYGDSPYQYQQPASRYYSNPYAMPQQNQYPYYDGDQYYVPPTSYGGNNQDNSAPAFSQKY
ncbi:MAG: hypothetical protein ACJAZX_001089 [Rickettsiales bacterium]|jgi:hypothetical protein